MNRLSWMPEGMPILCLPLWWVIKLVFLVIGFVFHPLSFLKKEHVLSQFKARKRKEEGEDE